MSEVIMLVGLPASGKSIYAAGLKDKGYVVLSSDELRKELYGNENHQDNNGDLFQELYKRAKDYLKCGKNVVIDATNINQKRRIAFINEFKQYRKTSVYFSTWIDQCYVNNIKRDRKVPDYVIDRMYKTLHIPIYEEGWNDIKIQHDSKDIFNHEKKYFENIIQNNVSYDEMFVPLKRWFVEFKNVFELPHDSTYHSFNVSRHTYYVWKYVFDNYQNEDKLVMLWAALLHDIGKTDCKNFKEGSRYANFIGHENVSAQITWNILLQIGYDEEFIHKVAKLVLLHMRLLNKEHDEKLLKFVGEETYKKLQFLREADKQAH